MRPHPESDKATLETQRPQAPLSRFDEAALFRDPYTVLSDIAGAPPRIAQAGTELDPTRKEGLKGGEAYRDPFDPINWPMTSTSPLEEKTPGRKESGSPQLNEEVAALIEGQGPRPSKGKPDATATPVQESEPAEALLTKPDKQEELKPVGLFADDESRNNTPANRPSAQRADEAAAPPNAANKLQAAISAALASLGTARPVTEVRETNEGSADQPHGRCELRDVCQWLGRADAGSRSCARQDYALDLTKPRAGDCARSYR